MKKLLCYFHSWEFYLYLSPRLPHSTGYLHAVLYSLIPHLTYTYFNLFRFLFFLKCLEIYYQIHKIFSAVCDGN